MLLEARIETGMYGQEVPTLMVGGQPMATYQQDYLRAFPRRYGEPSYAATALSPHFIFGVQSVREFDQFDQTDLSWGYPGFRFIWNVTHPDKTSGATFSDEAALVFWDSSSRIWDLQIRDENRKKVLHKKGSESLVFEAPEYWGDYWRQLQCQDIMGMSIFDIADFFEKIQETSP